MGSARTGGGGGEGLARPLQGPSPRACAPAPMSWERDQPWSQVMVKSHSRGCSPPLLSPRTSTLSPSQTPSQPFPRPTQTTHCRGLSSPCPVTSPTTCHHSRSFPNPFFSQLRTSWTPTALGEGPNLSLALASPPPQISPWLLCEHMPHFPPSAQAAPSARMSP